MEFTAVSASLAVVATLEDSEKQTGGGTGGGRDEGVCSGCNAGDRIRDEFI